MSFDPDDPVDDDEPRALWALPGLDPHSGGFGVDVTFLLLGGASTVALTLLLSALLRRRRDAVDVTIVGDAAGADEQSAP